MNWTNRKSLYRFGDGVIWVLGVIMSLLLIYYAFSLYGVRTQHANLILGLSMAIYYMLQFREIYGEKEASDAVDEDNVAVPIFKYIRIGRYLPQIDAEVKHVWLAVSRSYEKIKPALFLTLTALSLATALYIQFHFSRLLTEAPIAGNTQLDFLVGAIVIVLVTDVTTRAFGKIMGAVVVIGILFGFLGPYLPGLFYHGGLGLEQMIRIAAIGLGGVYGFILEIGATWVAIFLLLAGFTKSYGILDYIVEVSEEISKLTRTGIVHVAVVASLGFGSITGSGAANTATTGNFTIPMMKKQGVDKAYAGAVETVASIGGQLVPPIMGVAAFIMADLVGVPYLSIVQAGLIPAFLFYFSIVVAVQLLIFKHGWTSNTSGDVDYRLFLQSVWYMVPFAVLIYLLAVLRFSPLIAGYYTVLSLIGVFFVKTIVEDGRNGAKEATVKTVRGLRQGAVDMAALIAVLGSIGILIEVLTQTGFAQRLSTFMVGLAGGNLLLLLVLAMIVSLLFGLGMPAPAAYILTASLAATAMVGFGIRDITAHMFVFYFALYASFTPPVGPSTIIAAKLAEASYLETAKQSMRLAFPGFLIPFVFIANDSLIYWETPVTILLLLTTVICVIGLCMSMFAFDGRNHLSSIHRIVFLGLSLLGMFGTHLGVFDTYLYQVAVASMLVTFMAVSYFISPRVDTSGLTARSD
ncbi:TRAP transporter fused permease subunit [Halostagnicola sp. A-GB9-2]|uniref:TRAP transporter permease n=1 Tax=Halostagnicola sp. A-GB9-2 TaxID=3048066 RepID=UPI0024C031C2|nr:TRAP transporter fused permease subunit [Halostagnicola sp. A-GB9-2]MDJ1434375.1 TRAP transporter fused permease subunit [Halostagnicola sp. A-GB9-2]